MDPSAEKLVGAALRQIVVSRAAVVGLSMIGNGIKTVGYGLQNMGTGVEMLANACFTVEVDGARKYELLTGTRLGPAIGQPRRYTDIHPHGSGFPQTFAEREQEQES